MKFSYPGILFFRFLFLTFGVAWSSNSSYAYPDRAAACQQLSEILPNQVFPPGSTNYQNEASAFWSLAAVLQPYCVFVPKNANDLAKGIKGLVQHNSTFAIRSGGHAPVTGIASTNHGVLIATSSFTELKIVADRTIFGDAYVRVGAALRWGEIYEFLNPYGLTVLGGRVWGVGTGSILGGGMTFFSQQHGWMSNNVFNFELVTAAGKVLQVNARSNPDLFWALKNGGNNFGIVTRYDLKAFQQGQVWALNKIFLGDSTKMFIDAMNAWMVPGGGHEDVKGAIMPSTRYTPSSSQLDGAIVGVYDAPIKNANAFENFTAIPAIDLGSGVQNFSQVVETTRTQFGNDSFRWNWYSTSVKFSNRTMEVIVDTMIELAKELLPNLSGFVGVAEEPVSAQYVAAAQKNGGDPMNLDPKNGGFIVAAYYVAYKDSSEDAGVESYLETLISKVEEKTKAEGIYYPFLFQNTAGIKQEPLSSQYDRGSLKRMKDVSQKYDPHGIFQLLVPGHKLGSTLNGA